MAAFGGPPVGLESPVLHQFNVYRPRSSVLERDLERHLYAEFDRRLWDLRPEFRDMKEQICSAPIGLDESESALW